ncbi:hypothetical protein ACHAPT_000694 [Fusarium lateritium]
MSQGSSKTGFTEAELRQPGHYNIQLSDSESVKTSSTSLVRGQHHAFKKPKLDFQGLSADFAVIALPFTLVVVSFLILHLDGIPVDKETLSQWQNAITVLGTLFPILFAAVFGRLIYQTARWSLERGTALGPLEQLLGSRTVGGALVTQFQLQALNPLAVSLILVWAVSPLGAQSILRMLGSRLDEKTHPSSVVYFDTDAESQPSYNEGATGSSVESNLAFLSYLGIMFGAALLSPKSARIDSMDVWGNVKIPFLNATDNDDWQSVSWSPKLEHYSALVGIPVLNISTGNTTFSLETSYMDLKCYNMTKMELSDIAQYRDFDWPHWDPEGLDNGTWYGFNNTFQDDYRRSWAIASNRFVDQYWYNQTLLKERHKDVLTEVSVARPAIFENETGVEVEPAKIYFQAKLNNAMMHETPGFTAYCDVGQRYVESRVTCQRTSSTSQQNCTVTAQRPSQRRHAPEAITPLSFPAVFRWISKHLPIATGVRNAGTCDLGLQYLDKPDLDTMDNDVSGGFVNVDEELFSLRLSQVLNTYIHLSQMYVRALGSVPTEYDKWVKDKWNVTKPVEVVNLVEVYSVTGLWMGFCIFSCIALSVSGILSVFFTHLASGPDVLGYASTLVRDSRYIKMQPETGQMGGADMTVKMRDMRIRYGFTGQNSKGETWVGVGLQEETKRISDHLAQD